MVHLCVFYWPCGQCRGARFVHQHRHAVIDSRGQRHIATSAEYGRSARVRNDPRKICRGHCEGLIRILYLTDRLQEEAALRRVERALWAANHRGEFEATINVWKEWLQSITASPILEIVKCSQMTTSRHSAKKFAGRQIGRNAAGG